MIRFASDYLEGAPVQVLERLVATNMDQTPGYGEDEYCEKARAKIKTLIGRQDCDVHFMVGGTQTNATLIDAALRPYQGVISAVTGHIGVHESGAIEACGHKVLTIPTTDGKIRAHEIRKMYEDHWADVDHVHIVQPAMVYISQPTENGTLYSKAELTEIYETCQSCGLLLYVDGARLGYGLMSEKNDVSLRDLAALCDAFYIGGTKQGLLFGEALVLNNDALKKDYLYLQKRHGGLLAKGRLLGVQFDAIFENSLYFSLAKRADDLAMKVRKACEDLSLPLLYDSWTNQQFPVLPDHAYEALQADYNFCFWCKPDETHSTVRICTSWATKEEDVNALILDLMRLCK